MLFINHTLSERMGKLGKTLISFPIRSTRIHRLRANPSSIQSLEDFELRSLTNRVFAWPSRARSHSRTAIGRWQTRTAPEQHPHRNGPRFGRRKPRLRPRRAAQKVLVESGAVDLAGSRQLTGVPVFCVPDDEEREKRLLKNGSEQVRRRLTRDYTGPNLDALFCSLLSRSPCGASLHVSLWTTPFSLVFSQWTLTQGEFKHYIDDPYVKKVERAAVVCDVDVALLGGGFGSLVTGAKLRELGVKSLRVIEEAGGFGGTWYEKRMGTCRTAGLDTTRPIGRVARYWNRYPNACCDTESYIYLPLLDKTGFMPVEKYTKAPEILAYCDLLARKFDLYDGALFSTHIDELRWNEDAKRWFIRTNRGDLVRAKCVSCSVGNLTRAKLPGINGIAEFKGESFHTSRLVGGS